MFQTFGADVADLVAIKTIRLCEFLHSLHALILQDFQLVYNDFRPPNFMKWVTARLLARLIAFLQIIFSFSRLDRQRFKICTHIIGVRWGWFYLQMFPGYGQFILGLRCCILLWCFLLFIDIIVES